jgi:hypothetical protein
VSIAPSTPKVPLPLNTKSPPRHLDSGKDARFIPNRDCTQLSIAPSPPHLGHLSSMLPACSQHRNTPVTGASSPSNVDSYLPRNQTLRHRSTYSANTNVDVLASRSLQGSRSIGDGDSPTLLFLPVCTLTRLSTRACIAASPVKATFEIA